MSNTFKWHDNGTKDGTTWGNHQEPDPGDNTVKFTTIPRRLTAIVLDWMVPFLATIIVGNGLFSDVVYLAMLANSIVLQGMTGQSLGKMAVGLQLAYVPEKKSKRKWTFLVPSVSRCALRYFLHVLGPHLLIGFFKALMNAWGKSFADELCRTVVINDDRIELMRREP